MKRKTKILESNDIKIELRVLLKWEFTFNPKIKELNYAW